MLGTENNDRINIFLQASELARLPEQAINGTLAASNIITPLELRVDDALGTTVSLRKEEGRAYAAISPWLYNTALKETGFASGLSPCGKQITYIASRTDPIVQPIPKEFILVPQPAY